MKNLFFALALIIASCQMARAEQPKFTAEECTALGAMTAKFAYYHELWVNNHDNETIDATTGLAYKDSVPDLAKDIVIETVRKWGLANPPFDQPKYLDASLNAVEVAYAVSDIDKEGYLSVGQKAMDKCFAENPQVDDLQEVKKE
jgi:hypothetical protein